MATKPSYCQQILNGEAGFWVDVLCFPFVLTYHALRIYVFACIETLGRRSYRLFCSPCISCFFGWLFTDKDFEGQKAIGSDDAVTWVRATEMMSGKKKNGKPSGPKLYEGAIEAADLCQGAVGDCWLVAALACAAEHPGSIRKAFINREFNPRGRYGVRLFDPEKKTWVTVVVDDLIPCKKGTKQPIYMGCNGNELWAVLLEKVRTHRVHAALATTPVRRAPTILRASHASRPPRPLPNSAALTSTSTAGGPCGAGACSPATPSSASSLARTTRGSASILRRRRARTASMATSIQPRKSALTKSEVAWHRLSPTLPHSPPLSTTLHHSPTLCRPAPWPPLVTTARAYACLRGGRYTSAEVWNLILNYLEDDSLVAASGGKDMGAGGAVPNSGGLNGEQLNDAAGLVGTHAYSILDARELGLIPGLTLGAGLLGQTKLIKLRNPWGKYEWKGAWSDGSKEWNDNPLVKMRLRPVEADDGCFWMPWDAFYEAGFKQIDICDRTTKDDLKLDVNEDLGTCGICVGAAKGCTSFWCLCGGVRQIYFGSKTSAKTKTTKRGCQKCMSAQNVDEEANVKVTVTRA